MNCNDLKLMYVPMAHISSDDVDTIIILVYSLVGVLGTVIIVMLIWATYSYIKGLRADLKK